MFTELQQTIATLANKMHKDMQSNITLMEVFNSKISQIYNTSEAQTFQLKIDFVGSPNVISNFIIQQSTKNKAKKLFTAYVAAVLYLKNFSQINFSQIT